MDSKNNKVHFLSCVRPPILTDRIISKDCVEWKPNKELMSVFESTHSDSIAMLCKHGLNELHDKTRLMTLEEMQKKRN